MAMWTPVKLALVTALLSLLVLTDSVAGVCPVGCYCQSDFDVTCVDTTDCPQSLSSAYVSVSLTNSQNCGNSIDRTAFSALTGLVTLNIVNFPDYQVVGDQAFADTSLTSLAIQKTSVQSFFPGSLSGLGALITLDLSDNRISVLPDNLFKDLAKLDRLLLSANKISLLSTDMFTGLSLLRTLDLSNNSIAMLSPKCFQPLITLRSLKLSYNSITMLPDHFLIGVPMTSLIMDHNLLTSIDPKAFAESKLRAFKLEYNLLTELPGDALRTLNTKILAMFLSGNNIAKVGAGDATGLIFGSLLLDANPLKVIDSGAFTGSTFERTLDLHGTELTSLPADMGSVLSASTLLNLDALSGWNCDCDSLWLAEFLANSSTSKDPVCGNFQKTMGTAAVEIEALCTTTTSTTTTTTTPTTTTTTTPTTTTTTPTTTTTTPTTTTSTPTPTTTTPTTTTTTPTATTTSPSTASTSATTSPSPSSSSSTTTTTTQPSAPTTTVSGLVPATPTTATATATATATTTKTTGSVSATSSDVATTASSSSASSATTSSKKADPTSTTTQTTLTLPTTTTTTTQSPTTQKTTATTTTTTTTPKPTTTTTTTTTTQQPNTPQPVTPSPTSYNDEPSNNDGNNNSNNNNDDMTTLGLIIGTAMGLAAGIAAIVLAICVIQMAKTAILQAAGVPLNNAAQASNYRPNNNRSSSDRQARRRYSRDMEKGRKKKEERRRGDENDDEDDEEDYDSEGFSDGPHSWQPRRPVPRPAFLGGNSRVFPVVN